MKAIERPSSWFNADYDEPKYPRCRCCNREVDRYYYDFGDELIYCQSCVDKLMFSMRAEDDEQEKRERAIEKAQEQYFRKEEKNARLAGKECRTD